VCGGRYVWSKVWVRENFNEKEKTTAFMLELGNSKRPTPSRKNHAGKGKKRPIYAPGSREEEKPSKGRVSMVNNALRVKRSIIF